ncbi:MAG: phytoene desaturase family protein [Actinomycetota bacterium]
MSATPYDAVVIGAGHNGLVCAAYLARTGLRVLVLERRDRPGGAADTVKIARGFQVPAAAHTVGRLRGSVVRDLQLAEHGLRLIEPEARAFLPGRDGRGLTLWSDPGRTARELAALSPADAQAYPRFDAKLRSLASFMARLHSMTPPDLERPSLGDARKGLALVRGLRGLGGAAQSREALRILPMPVADLVAEAFETDLLRAAVAARGVQYTAMSPRSAGTTAVLLSDSVGGDAGAAGQATLVAGGPGVLATSLASAARGFGVRVRCGTEVAAVTTDGEASTGVALLTGEEIPARAVVSAADPKRTLLGLLDPAVLGPTLAWRVGNIRATGAVAKVNLALDGLPRFEGADEDERLRGRILLTAGLDHLDQAIDASKYGRFSESPFVEATIPSLSDPSLAPEGRHVMSLIVHSAPYHLREGGWDERRDQLGDVVLKTLEEVAPGISGLVRERQVLTPLDLERDYGLTEGHPLHAEPGLDQFFAWRPLWGWARYRMPVRGLYLCGAGAHPGGGVTGAPGANAAREILADLRRGG